jgi:hypothetical protein
MPEGSKAIGLTKRDTLVLQGGGLGHEAESLIPIKILKSKIKTIPLTGHGGL